MSDVRAPTDGRSEKGKGRMAMEGASAVSPIVSEINCRVRRAIIHHRPCALTFWLALGSSAEVCMETMEEMSLCMLNEASLPLSGLSSHGMYILFTALHTPASRANKHHEPPAIIGEIISGSGLAASFTDGLPRFRLLLTSTSPSHFVAGQTPRRIGNLAN